MNLRTELKLALRYMRPKRNAISVITLISVIGVVLGVMVLVVVLSVMNGLTDLKKNGLLKTTPHIQISLKDKSAIEEPARILETLKKYKGHGAAVVARPVVVQTKERLLPKLAIGVDYSQLEGYIDINWQLNDFGKMGQKLTPLMQGTVATGQRSTARQLFVHFGDKVLLHSPAQLMKLVNIDKEGSIKAAERREITLPTELTLDAFFSTGSREFDDNTVLLNLDDANDLFDMSWGSADVVYGWVRDPFDMDRELSGLRDELGKTYIVQSWMQIHQKILGVLQVEKNMMFFLLIFIVLVAAFSITNTLITVVHQKTREIGLLNSLGATPGTIMRIFILQGLLVGLIGGVLGVIGGIVMVHWRNQIIRFFSRVTGQEILPDNVYVITELPARLAASDLVTVGLIAILMCTLAALIPALRAAKLDPAKALRYE